MDWHRRLASPYAAFGVLCALGTQSDGLFGGIVFADIIIGLWAVYVLARHRVLPHWSVLALLAAILPGLLWTDTLFYTATPVARMFGLAVIAAWLLRRERDSFALTAGLSIGVAVQALGLVATITTDRPAGLSLNASQVSSTGLMLWMVSPLAGIGLLGVGASVLHMGIGLGRTVLLAAAVFALFGMSRRRILACVALGAVSVLAMTLQGNADRFMPWTGVPQHAVALRNELLVPPVTDSPVPSTSVTLPPDEPPRRAGFNIPWERLRGFGWGSYVASTGQLRPHNLFVLTWYEMGLLSVVPFGMLGWAVWRRKLPWGVWGALFVLAMLTEEMTGRPEGAYMLAVIAVAYLPAVASGIPTRRSQI